MLFTLKKLTELMGSLSKPGKMPGYGWGISAWLCITGSKLALIEDTPCSKCYARKKRYKWAPVKLAQERRLEAWKNQEKWSELMAELIARRSTPEVPYFRWFDSGDLQSVKMLQDIIDVCRRTPNIKHWLPTQERKMLNEYLADNNLPDNLVVRVSATKIGGSALQGYANTSRILPKSSKDLWPTLSQLNNKQTYHCSAPLQGHKCGACRACWNPEVKDIVYLED